MSKLARSAQFAISDSHLDGPLVVITANCNDSAPQVKKPNGKDLLSGAPVSYNPATACSRFKGDNEAANRR
jgi:hypothetical protein